jgi:hypothetical protein
MIIRLTKPMIMSKHRNRALLTTSLTSKEYKLKQQKHYYDYCLICSKRCGSFYYDCSPQTMRAKGRHGNGKIISTFDAREYRTWKYNRKTQYK